MLMKPKDGRPTDQELAEVCSGGVDAMTAKWRLMFFGYKVIEIERAYGSGEHRGILETLDNWNLAPAQ